MKYYTAPLTILQVQYENFKKLTNTLKKKEQQSTNPYPWLAEDDERKLADREILEKWTDLEVLWLIQKEKEELLHMLYRYKEAFTLRGVTGTCLTIKVQLDVVYKQPFFIKPYSKEEEKHALCK